MGRTKNAMLNVLTICIGQTLNFLISYGARMIFVAQLSKEFVGLDGLFGSLVQILSFFELGVGTAIVFSLYKPLAQNDVEKIKSLMQLYKKTYITIGLLIFVLGATLLPFLGLLVHVSIDLSFVRLLFFLFVVNAAVSYFFSYRASLITADQKKYITTIINYSFRIVLRIVQSIVLIITHNYVLYLILQVAFTITENIVLSAYACRKYPYIKDKNIQKLDDSELKGIIKNIRALIMHRVGGTFYESTDNLLLSVFSGVINVGLYTNYKFLISAVTSVMSQIFNALTASVGNLNVTESKEKSKAVFYAITLVCFWSIGFFSIAFYCLLNPFIELSFGADYLFPMNMVFALVLVFYLNGIRNANLMTKGSLGLFWNDRYRPVLQALVNLVASVFLASYFGMVGIFLGTSISVITTCTFYDAIILFRFGFCCSITPYLKKFLFYNASVFLSGLATIFLCSFVNDGTIKAFIVKALLCVGVSNVVFLICFYKTDEFKYLSSIALKLLKGSRRK